MEENHIGSSTLILTSTRNAYIKIHMFGFHALGGFGELVLFQ